MATTVDERVVSMEFDNARFEQNISQSSKSLKTFNENLDSTFSDKSVAGLSKAIQGIPLGELSDGISSIQMRFSAMGIATTRIIERLTDSVLGLIGKVTNFLFGGITSGGLARAMNIENAKFAIEGLGIAWDKVEADISYGVNDTAYGFDAAAKAAASLAASGVELGGIYEDGAEEVSAMGRALRGISGVAAMTNTDYSYVADIFATVAGNGKLMGDQLRMLSGRGMNAAAIIADYFNDVSSGAVEATDNVKKAVKEMTKGSKISEANIREFVTKGKINFDIFSEAMDTTFGEHAKEANKTFNGSLSNMRAAMSRIGALFYAPLIKEESPVIQLINSFTGQLKKLQKQIGPVAEIVTDFINFIAGRSKEIVDAFDFDISGSENGIEAFIEGILNVFEQLSPIANRFGSIIKDAFPKSLPDIISDISSKISELLVNFKISDKTATNLTKTFKGIISIVSLAKQAVVALIKAVVPMSDDIGGLADMFLEFTGSIGDWLYEVDLAARRGNFFAKTIETIKNIIEPVFFNIKMGLTGLIAKFKEFASTKLQLPDLSNFNILDKLKTPLAGLQSFVEKVIELFGKLASQTQKLDASFKFSTVTVALTFLAKRLLPIFKLFRAASGDILPVFANEISSTFATFTTAINEFTTSIKFKNLQNIAISIAILTGALAVLTMLDQDKLAASLGVITGLMVDLVAAMTTFQMMGVGQGIGSVGKLAVTMISLSASVLILASAMKKLSDINPEQLGSGLTVITTLLGELTGISILLSETNAVILTGASALIEMSAAVLILTVAIKKLGEMDANSLEKGLSAVTRVLLAFAGLMVISSIAKMGVGMGVSFIAIAASMLILQKALSSFGEMDIDALKQGISAFRQLLIIIAVFSAIAEKIAPTMILTAAGLTVFAVAIGLMTPSIVLLGKYAKESGRGLFVIAGALLILGAAGTLLSGSSIGIAALSASLIVFAGALFLLVPQLILLGTYADKAAVGLKIIAGALLMMGVAGLLLSPFVPVILALSAAVSLLGVACFAVGAGITMLATGLATLAISGVAGAASLVAAVGIMVSAIPLIATALAKALILFVTTLAQGAANIITALSNLIGSILDAIIQNIPKFVQIGIDIVNGIITGLKETVPNLVETAITIYDEFSKSLASHMDSIVETGVNTVIAYINGIAAKLPDIIQAGINLALAFINGTADGIRNNYQAVNDAITNLLSAILETIAGQLPQFLSGGIDVISSFLEGAVSMTASVAEAAVEIIGNLLKELGIPDDFVEVGKDVINGFINGIKTGIDGVIEVAKTIGHTAIDTLRNVLRSHSDSKETIDIGYDTGHGYGTGVESTVPWLKNVFHDVGKDTVTEMAEGAEEGSDAFNVVADNLKDTATDVAEHTEKETEKTKKSWLEQWVISQKVKKAAKEAEANGGDVISRQMAQNKEVTDEATESADEYTTSLGKVGSGSKSAGKATQEMTSSLDKAIKAFKSFEDLQKSLQEKIESSIDIFSEFDKKTELTGDKLLENMRSQVSGVKEWANNLKTLASRGIEKGLLQKLSELGPQGFEKVNAFVQMSDEQLKEANGLYAESLMLPDSVSADIVGSFANAGMWASEGFAGAVDTNAGYQPGQLMGQSLLKGTMEALDEHSPSKATAELAENANIGFVDELGRAYWIGRVKLNAMKLGEAVVEGIAKTLGSADIAQSSRKAIASFVKGIAEAKGVVKTTKTVCQTFINTLKDNLPDKTFTNIVNNIFFVVSEAVKKNSKTLTEELLKQTESLKKKLSDAFIEVGEYASEGLAKGIEKKIKKIAEASVKVSKEAVKQAQKTFEEKSPSRVMAGIGEYATMGLAQGMVSKISYLTSSVDDVSSVAISRFQNALSKVQDAMPDTGDNFTITPVLDLSQVENGVSNIESMFNSRVFGVTTAVNARYASGSFDRRLNDVAKDPQLTQITNNYEFNQTNNSPKALSNAEIYRQTNNLISRYRRGATS